MGNEIEKGKIHTLKDFVSYQENSIVSKKVVESEGGGLTVFAFDKGQRLSEHTAPFDATILVIDGESEVIINGISNFLKEGEFIIMPANIPHAVKAPTPFKMVLTLIKNRK